MIEVHAALKARLSGTAEKLQALKPAVPVRRSVAPDFIVGLEDGKKLVEQYRGMESSTEAAGHRLYRCCGHQSPSRPLMDTAAHVRWLDDVLPALSLNAVSIVGISLGDWIALDDASRGPQSSGETCRHQLRRSWTAQERLL